LICTSRSRGADLFVAFCFSAFCEQIGWSGYATDRLQQHWNALDASIMVRSVWAIGHVIPFIQLHHNKALAAVWVKVGTTMNEKTLTVAEAFSAHSEQGGTGGSPGPGTIKQP
jgi:hypothetical protein